MAGESVNLKQTYDLDHLLKTLPVQEESDKVLSDLEMNDSSITPCLVNTLR